MGTFYHEMDTLYDNMGTFRHEMGTFYGALKGGNSFFFIQINLIITIYESD